ncbi:MAG: YggT family protein [Chloroflexota bacterium]|nr:YggT family protein [Chloroflexota bacterium]
MPPLIGLLSSFIYLLQFLFIARFIAQLLDARGGNPITRLLIDLTEPILAPVRRILPSTGMIDFSPTVVLLLLVVLQRVLISSF